MIVGTKKTQAKGRAGNRIDVNGRTTQRDNGPRRQRPGANVAGRNRNRAQEGEEKGAMRKKAREAEMKRLGKKGADARKGVAGARLHGKPSAQAQPSTVPSEPVSPLPRHFPPPPPPPTAAQNVRWWWASDLANASRWDQRTTEVRV